MQLENIDIKDKLHILIEEKDKLFDQFLNIETKVLRDRYNYSSNISLVFYRTSDGRLDYFSISNDSLQPLDEGEIFVNSLPCGFDISFPFRQVIMYDEDRGESYIETDNGRVYECGLMDYYFSDECVRVEDLDPQREEWEERYAANILETKVDLDVDIFRNSYLKGLI